MNYTNQVFYIFKNDSFNKEILKYNINSRISKPQQLRALLIKKYRDTKINIGDFYDAYFKKSSANELSYPAKKIDSKKEILKTIYVQT